VREAATVLKVDPSRVRQLIASGAFESAEYDRVRCEAEGKDWPAYQRPGWTILKSEVLAWKRRQAQAGANRMSSEGLEPVAAAASNMASRREAENGAADPLAEYRQDPQVYNMRLQSIGPEALEQLTGTMKLRHDSAGSGPRPRWDSATRTLYFGDQVCKKFRQPAKNQELILAAFQELGWPPRIDDPLPGGCVTPAQRLADTLTALKEQRPKQLIDFSTDGRSDEKKGILWFPTEASL
jgi:hypothetical protein